MECSICVSNFNKSNRKKVECPNCHMEICRACISTYVLDSTQEAHCMGCKVRFTDEFMEANFTKKWTNEVYRTHRVNLKMNEQKSLLPETEEYARRMTEVSLMRERYAEMKNKFLEKKRELKELNEQMRDLNWAIGDMMNKPMTTESQKREFVMPCVHSDCKGYLNNQYKCGTCDRKVCSKCHKEKGDDHECVEDDVNVGFALNSFETLTRHSRYFFLLWWCNRDIDNNEVSQCSTDTQDNPNPPNGNHMKSSMSRESYPASSKPASP